MKKLTRKNLNELKKEMPVISEQELRLYVGGYDPNDCWWRCMAYVNSGGSSYSQDDAMDLARAYFGQNFSESSYALSGNKTVFDNYVANYMSGASMQAQILVFDTSLVPTWTGGGSNSRHAVMITSMDYEYYHVYDPQNQSYGRIERSLLDTTSGAGFIVNIN